MAALIVAALFVAVFVALVWADYRDQYYEDPTDPARGPAASYPQRDELAPGGPTCPTCGDPVIDPKEHSKLYHHPSGGER